MIGFLDLGQRHVLDMKNTALADLPGLELQTAGYAILWEENTGERVDGRGGLWVPSKGRRWRLLPCASPDARTMFLAALWKLQHPTDPGCLEAQRALDTWAAGLRQRY